MVRRALCGLPSGVVGGAARGDYDQRRPAVPNKQRCSSGTDLLKRPSSASIHDVPALSTSNPPWLWW